MLGSQPLTWQVNAHLTLNTQKDQQQPLLF